MELKVNSLFGLERAYLIESKVDSNHVFSFLQGHMQREMLEQTDFLKKFHEFPWISMQFYAHASYWLQKILIV